MVKWGAAHLGLIKLHCFDKAGTAKILPSPWEGIPFQYASSEYEIPKVKEEWGEKSVRDLIDWYVGLSRHTRKILDTQRRVRDTYADLSTYLGQSFPDLKARVQQQIL